MERYYVNKNPQSNGDHEVHKEGCSYSPSEANRRNLGYSYNCHEAIVKATSFYKQVNGCFYCCGDCHNE